MFIIEFFEYTLTGWLFWIYFFVMIICSLACLGVVGEKVSKKRQEELLAKREAAAQEEYKKAQELIDKQAHSYGVDNTLDPTAKKEVVATVPPAQTTPQVVNEVVSQEVEKPKEQEVIVFDAPATTSNEEVVDNVTPIVDNTNEESVKTDVPAVLVINDDGTSNAT